MVALTWTDQLIEPRNGESVFERYDVQPRIASAFIISVRKEWFLVTAGHVLKSVMDDAKKVGRRTFRFGIMDGFHHHDRAAQTIPIPFEDDRRFWIDHPSGLDYGVINIRPLVRANLINNDVRCLDEQLVAGIDEEFDAYAVIGFPDEQFHRRVVDGEHERHAALRILVPMLPVERVASPPEDIILEGHPFLGRVVSLEGQFANEQTLVLDSIEGMSGGPVFGLRIQEGSIDVRLVAVQSGWFKRHKLMTASPMIFLVNALGKRLDELTARTAVQGSTPRSAANQD